MYTGDPTTLIVVTSEDGAVIKEKQAFGEDGLLRHGVSILERFQVREAQVEEICVPLDPAFVVSSFKPW